MILCIDTEQTTWNKGSPFDNRNFNVCISFAYRDDAGKLVSGTLFKEDYQKARDLFNRARKLVFFNAKYDLHWLRKLDFDYRDKRIWCCQVFEFLHGRQTRPFPSLADTSAGYGLGAKIDIVDTEYWSKGINTHEIPREVLANYATQDASLTYQIYEKQLEIQKPHQRVLFSLSMQDLVCLADMEWNGMYYNIEKSHEKAKELETEILALQSKLSLFHAVPSFNWGSPDHLSALLYGGEIKEIVKVPDGYYKSGQKKGQLKFKNEEKTYILPRMYTPVSGSELQKDNKWSVEEQYLRRLKGDESLISGILKLKELQKLCSTYYEGLPKLYDAMNGTGNIIHGSFNQCVAQTGRLSSSKPNLQNLSEHAQELFETRWTN